MAYELIVDLPKLKSQSLPHCTLDDVLRVLGGSFTKTEGCSQEQFDRELAAAHVEFNEYGKEFLPPREKCIGCDWPLAGLLAGTFVWGLANGEGKCGRCGYPARAIHRKEHTGGLTFQRILQYHPDTLVTRGEQAGAA